MAAHSSSAAPSSSSSAAAAAAASSSQYSYANGSSFFPLPFHLQQPPAVSQYPSPYVAAPPIPVPPPPVVAPVYPAPAPVAGVYSLPQYQQAQQLFQRDAQAITPEALESVKAALANSEIEHKAEAKKKAIPRKAAGLSWEDPTLAEWPENDYRLFCGDLGNEVNDDVLSKAFSRFPSFNMARLKSAEQFFFYVLAFMDYVFDLIPGLAWFIGWITLTELESGLEELKSSKVWAVFRELATTWWWVVDWLKTQEVVRDKRTGKTKGYGFVSFANPSDLAAALKEMNGKYVGNRPIKLRKSNWRERTDYETLQRHKATFLAFNQSQKRPKLSKKSVLHKLDVGKYSEADGINKFSIMTKMLLAFLVKYTHTFVPAVNLPCRSEGFPSFKAV
ncbi:hypothetical protein TIFTF001_001041 [Ficus carica]|uniref:RRM domain-containing protein n=1 Tax=Ficus carica TaxID=3494 RepID=A0AA88CL92_FICCA|nr:hypothetical protein TIFTF001_001041 [Ficus carica]